MDDRVYGWGGSIMASYDIRDMDHVPVVLDWGIEIRVYESLVKIGLLSNTSNTYNCQVLNPPPDSTDQMATVQCFCKAGFAGNPYLGHCEGKLLVNCTIFLFYLATDHYSVNRMLGQGGQGTVYKGMLADGKIIAVKKSKILDEGNLKQFIHRNLVKLMGCCLETEVPLLVNEFIPNGTLSQLLHSPSDELPFTWEMRLRIATEVSGALSYLHSAASIPIYHRDIKSTNILLDDKYRAKVADFGTSKSVTIDQTHVTTLVQGTFGYLDPEYFQSSQFTDKSDVYSFRVVLVEFLTGQKAVSFCRSEDEARSLVTYFLMSIDDNRLAGIDLDPQVKV